MKKNKKIILSMVLAGLMGLSFAGCGAAAKTGTSSSANVIESRPETNESLLLPAHTYELKNSTGVGGRQGITTDGENYYVSGSKVLIKYDHDWNEISRNENPFDGYELEVNHIGDIDFYNGELYLGVEYFMDGKGSHIQIAVYDAETLKMKRTFPFKEETGQLEVSGITVNPDDQRVCMCSWVGGESGRYLYEYDLNDGSFVRKINMQCPPYWIQGVVYMNNAYYVTADDGDADRNESDHIYRVNLTEGSDSATVALERTFDDVTRQGEIEGLAFDTKAQEFLLLYNRGAKIILGMPSGFYDGYTEEISEVFTYSYKEIER